MMLICNDIIKKIIEWIRLLIKNGLYLKKNTYVFKNADILGFHSMIAHCLLKKEKNI